ncbi:hypothetical protein PINS_up008522 [Pythium insidiosum]|nr:hypothetical protein PINS_up008522 [Pythium insidiosum]
MAASVLSLRRQDSSEGRKSALFDKLNASMDHALSTLLLSAAERPAFVRPVPSTDDAAAAWLQLDAIVSSRKREIERKAQRAKLKAKKAPRDRESAVDGKAEKAPKKAASASTTTSSAPRVSPRAASASATTPTVAAVKLLDLSGANLSPVLSHSSARADRVPVADLASDVVTQLKSLPMLETLQAGTKKCDTLIKWVEGDDGKNRAPAKHVMTLIGKLQRDGLVPPNTRENGRKPGRLREETLDERLMKEGEWNGRAGRRRRLSTASRRPSKSRHKRPLGGFIASDEEESDQSGEYSEDEGEYEGSSESEEAEVEFEAPSLGADGDYVEDEEDDDTGRKRARIAATNGSRSKKITTPQPSPRAASAAAAVTTAATAATATASPKATTPVTTASTAEELRIKEELSAKEQLARVTARLREVEQDEAAALSTQTYLSYDSKKSPTKKASTPKPRASSGPKKSADGSSVSTAIVLEDSDEDEDDDDDAALVNTAPITVAKAKPTPGTPPPASKAPPAPAKPRNLKRKTEQEDDDEDEDDDEEDAAMEQAGSSTDEDQDLFDLDDEDVYVVESLLEMRVGRTIVTNGRRSKEADLYLVKWEGYNELTWEPDANIPKRLIQFYKEREAAKRACQFQIGEFLERRVAKNSTTVRDEIIYLIRWANQPHAYWEVRSNLPEKTVVWLEKTNRASQGKAVAGSSARKKVKRN